MAKREKKLLKQNKKSEINKKEKLILKISSGNHYIYNSLRLRNRRAVYNMFYVCHHFYTKPISNSCRMPSTMQTVNPIHFFFKIQFLRISKFMPLPSIPKLPFQHYCRCVKKTPWQINGVLESRKGKISDLRYRRFAPWGTVSTVLDKKGRKASRERSCFSVAPIIHL